MTSVAVWRPDESAKTYARSTVDIFDADGTLTVTAVDDGALLGAHADGTWTEAVAYDEGGNVTIAFIAGEQACRR